MLDVGCVAACGFAAAVTAAKEFDSTGCWLFWLFFAACNTGLSLLSKSNPSVLTSATRWGEGQAMCGCGQVADDLGQTPPHLNAGVI